MTRFFKLKYLPVFAMVLGGGLAVANKVTTVAPNVYNAAAAGQPADWQPIGDNTISCEANPSRECTGVQTGSTVSVVDYGNTKVN